MSVDSPTPRANSSVSSKTGVSIGRSRRGRTARGPRIRFARVRALLGQHVEGPRGGLILAAHRAATLPPGAARPSPASGDLGPQPGQAEHPNPQSAAPRKDCSPARRVAAPATRSIVAAHRPCDYGVSLICLQGSIARPASALVTARASDSAGSFIAIAHSWAIHAAHAISAPTVPASSANAVRGPCGCHDVRSLNRAGNAQPSPLAFGHSPSTRIAVDPQARIPAGGPLRLGKSHFDVAE